MSAAEEMASILKRLEKEETEKFTAVVSNPPYQKMSEGNGQALPIYQEFYDISLLISEIVSMIFKDNWTTAMNDRMSKLHEWRRKKLDNRDFSTIDFVGNVFAPSTEVSVVIVSSLNKKPNKLTVDGTKIDYPSNGAPILPRNKNISILNKIGIPLVNSVETIVFDFRQSGLGYAQVRSAKEENKTEGNVKLIAYRNKKPVFFYADFEESVLDNANVSAPFKHVFAQMRPWKQNTENQYWTMSENEIPGEKFSAIPFNSKEELTNYRNYISTSFWLYCSLLSQRDERWGNHSFIPLLDFATGEILDKPGTYLDFSKPETLDEQLAEIYELTEEEQELMRKDLKPWKDKVDVEADR